MEDDFDEFQRWLRGLIMYTDEFQICLRDIWFPRVSGLYKEISVDELDGTQHKIVCDIRMTSVESLSQTVEERTGIPQREFTLIHNGEIMKPRQSLSSFNIRYDSHIQLLRVKKDQDKPTNLKDFVFGIFNGLYGQIENLFSFFPQFFQDRTRKLSEKDYVKISKLICNGWQLLGGELGLDGVTLDHIKSDNSSERLRIVGMLREWHRQNPLEATAGKLLGAIKSCKVKCDFETLKRALLIGI